MRAVFSDVQAAVANGTLAPAFQPLVELRSGQLVGFEALARWHHPSLGPILPENFISIAEKHSLIDALSFQVLAKAMRALISTPATLRFGLNISPHQLRDRSLPQRIRAAAEEAGFPVSRLIVEITESGFVDNMARAQAITEELKEMGCRLALDDCGTGYSCLTHIQKLRFDILKVDRSFIRDMVECRESRKIAAAMIGLGQNLGMVTVAEGVETAAQAELLLSLGCTVGQGYLFGRPAPAEQVNAMIWAPAWPIPSSCDANLDAGFVAESSPAQHLAQLRAVYDGSPAGLCFVDRELRYVSVNRSLAERDGLPVAAHLGRTMAEVLPELFPEIEPYVRSALAGTATRSVEVTRNCLNVPYRRTALVSFEPARDEGGDVVGVSIAVFDITDWKKAENALRETEDILHGFMHLGPHSPWVADAFGNVVEVSSRWLALTGLTEEQSLGRGWMDAIHPEDLDRVVAAMSKGMESGTSAEAQFRVRCRDGAYRWVRERAWPRHDAAGRVVRWYGYLEDVDQQQGMEDRLFSFLKMRAECRFTAQCPTRKVFGDEGLRVAV